MQIIAEIGLSHEGSLGQAMAYCDAVAKAGADVVKFQCHAGDPVSQFRPGVFYPQDENRQAYWERTGFNQHDWEELEIHAHKCGLEFCVSYFSHKAIDLLEGIRVDYHKLGSAQTADLSLVERVALKPGPIILSSGMSSWSELDNAIDLALRIKSTSGGMRPQDNLFAMHCVSSYPTPPEDVGLNIMAEMMQRYKIPIGYSCHSGRTYPMKRAHWMGAALGEIHVCWHRGCFGADVKASITVDELGELIDDIRYGERMKPVDKDEQAKSMADMRRLFRV